MRPIGGEDGGGGAGWIFGFVGGQEGVVGAEEGGEGGEVGWGGGGEVVCEVRDVGGAGAVDVEEEGWVGGGGGEGGEGDAFEGPGVGVLGLCVFGGEELGEECVGPCGVSK